MGRLLDWVGFQILMHGPHRIVCNPDTKFGTWCLERAGSWAYGRPGEQA